MAIFAFLMTGCRGQSPVSLLPTLVPIAGPAAGEPTVTPTAVTAAADSENQRSLAEGLLTGLTAEPPTPDTIGLRPRDAEQKYVPDAGPDLSEEWRPPAYEAPLAYHPDDHYWLIRPIPSGSRNFDLEWYPFGNDVQAANVPRYRVHHGMDFPNETGTPVLAAGSGTVIHAGTLTSPRNGLNYYGNTVVIHHDWQWQGEDVFTLYAHTLELFVEEGDYVEQGEVIAGVGSSGEVTGPHLHFEVRVGVDRYGAARNPALWVTPFEGWGTIAGRFVDINSRLISGATLTLTPEEDNGIFEIRRQMTYHPTVPSDDVWRENFVFGDVPAGTYTLVLDANDGVHRYRREVEVQAGQTSFEVVSTNFEFRPTPEPFPTPEPTSTLPPELIPAIEVTPDG